MTRWRDFERAEREFAQRVRGLFDAHRHKTIATVRSDGSPRISGIEAVFEDGDLVFGSMPNARKGADLQRDPRFALHSATVDPVEGVEAQWPGEAKISGRAIAAEPMSNGSDGDLFHADIIEVVHTHLNKEATMLVIEWWTPTHGLRRIEREWVRSRCARPLLSPTAMSYAGPRGPINIVDVPGGMRGPAAQSPEFQRLARRFRRG